MNPGPLRILRAFGMVPASFQIKATLLRAMLNYLQAASEVIAQVGDIVAQRHGIAGCPPGMQQIEIGFAHEARVNIICAGVLRDYQAPGNDRGSYCRAVPSAIACNHSGTLCPALASASAMQAARRRCSASVFARSLSRCVICQIRFAKPMSQSRAG